MGRSLDKVSRKKSDDRKNGRVKRRGLSRRRKQRGGVAKTAAVNDALTNIKLLLADTTGMSAVDIGTQSDIYTGNAKKAVSGSIDKEDQAVIDEINTINENIQKVVTFLKTSPTPTPTPTAATGTELEVTAYAELYKIENKVQNTSLYTGLKAIYSNLKIDGTLDTSSSSAAAAAVAATVAATVTPSSLPDVKYVAVFVHVTENGTKYEVTNKTGTEHPYAYVVVDSAGSIILKKSDGKTAVTCDKPDDWEKHTI